MQSQTWFEPDATSASSGLLSCTACHEEVLTGTAARCPSCRALYHVPCWNDLTGCVTPGCKGHRRVANRGRLTLLSDPAVVVERPAPEPPPVRLPAPAVELLPTPESVEERRARRRPGWVVVAAVAVAALCIGIAATLAVVRMNDAHQQNSGYRAGWRAGYTAGQSGAFDNGYQKGDKAGYQAGYQKGYLDGCHAAQGADAACSNSIVAAGSHAPAPAAYR